VAQYWDLLRGDTSLWPDKFFYLQCVREYGQPVLDVGCGTGRILLHFVNEGIDADGVDNSPEMLALLHQKAGKFGLKPTTYQQQMQRLSLPRKQTIIVPSSSFRCCSTGAAPPRHAPVFRPFAARRDAGHAVHDLMESGRSTRE
jgi:ubiquinone/menaquinone biosynthesis C-methylase UbiE